MKIPAFPSFKKIDLSDKTAIESYAYRYQPYSTFNFTNLWAWDTRDERMISELNGNLIVRFTDYKTSEPFLSFLGTYKSEDTVRQLLHFAEVSGVSPVLRFITEETAQDLQATDLHIVEDRHNFDYIFSVSSLSDWRGSHFKARRHLAKRFFRENPDARFELRDLRDTSVQKQVIAVLRRWEHKKKLDKKEYDLEHEERALNRLLETAQNHNLILSCVLLYNDMLGFSIDEILPHNYAMAHFIKADNTFKGIYEFLNGKVSQYFVDHDVVLWNWQQDLNIEGLRNLKMSHHPVNFLKKYRVSLLSL